MLHRRLPKGLPGGLQRPERFALSLSAILLLVTMSGFGHAHASSFKFPKTFIWGAATAAHQIEGDNENSDWWEWEQQCHLANCEKSGIGDDGYHRYPEDMQIAQSLGFNAYRM